MHGVTLVAPAVLCDLPTQGLEILKFTLTQPCLDLDTITSHIADMKVSHDC